LVEWLARLARPSAGARPRTICAALRREAEARLAGAARAYAAASRDLRAQARRREQALRLERVEVWHG
jgi:hypothetical protein